MASEAGNPNTESENLFEEYLTEHGYVDWTHERPVEGKRKRPDYRLELGGFFHFFEVKEFDARLPSFGGRSYDPYEPIRQKIHQVRRQFMEYKESPCSLVLANPNAAFVHLCDPSVILGAMLGNLGYTVPIGAKAEEDRSSRDVFLIGGKMVNEKRREPQNTTVSSIVVLETFPLRENLIRKAIKERQAELGRITTIEEDLTFYGAIPDSADLRRVRVCVYENPFARIPHNRDSFNGPFDQRWGTDGEVIKRVYVGTELARFDEALGER
jgi:hypothetical protein